MALDEGAGGGGGECWRCGGFGFATEWLSEPEARRTLGPLPPGAEFISASATVICDCAAGDRVRKAMSNNRADGAQKGG